MVILLRVENRRLIVAFFNKNKFYQIVKHNLAHYNHESCGSRHVKFLISLLTDRIPPIIFPQHFLVPKSVTTHETLLG
jgi:hypothetical protein